MKKLVLKTVCITLAGILALGVILFGIFALISPKTIANVADKMGNYSVSVFYYEKAYETITQSYTYQSETGSLGIQVRDLYAMLALKTGDKTTFEALETEIKESGEYGVPFTEDVTAYREGKKTLKEIVMDGGYDLL